MCIYRDFAHIYDELMVDIDYCKWADYIEDIFKKNNIIPGLIADLGCGTGSFCLEMARRGYDMIGIDISVEMLSRAVAKLESSGVNKEKVLFLEQDMSGFELYGTVDAIVSLVDSVNYITQKSRLINMFKLVKNYLNPSGVFIFDINSVYKFEEILDNNVFYSIDDDISYIWENKYNRKNKLCEFNLTFFIKEGELYRKFEEVHYEKAYSVEELSEIIRNTGLEITGIYGGLNFQRPGEKSERLFFVCKKV